MVEHFKVWAVQPVEWSRDVKLKGQFDKEAWETRTDSIQYLCNPVNKNDEGLQDARSHLVGYRLQQNATPEPRRWVDLANQFGHERWHLSDPFLLLLPAAKTIPPQTPPLLERRIDHYLCYVVVDARRRHQPCTLVDQFDQQRQHVETVRELEPAFFGVPVEKNGEPIFDPETHLAIYNIEPQTNLHGPITASTIDQFRPSILTATRSLMLAVPSKKPDWGLL